MITDQLKPAPSFTHKDNAMEDQARTSNIARGLAKAANHLAATNETSAFALIGEALALGPDSLVLATNCLLSLRCLDATRLEKAADLARAHIYDYPELTIVLRELEKGPLRSIALSRRLDSTQHLHSPAIPGRIAYVLHS